MPIFRTLVLITMLGPSPLGSQPPGSADFRVRTVADTLIGGVGGVAVDGLGAIYVADFGETVYKVLPDGRVSVFATGLYGSSGNAIDASGRLLQSSFNGNYVVRIDRDGSKEVVAEGLQGPVGVAAAPTGEFYVSNCRGNSISRVGPQGAVTSYAESPLLNCPNGLTRGPDGTLYVANFADSRVLAVDGAGGVTELARLPGGGNGHLALARGALYVTSFQSHRVFRVQLDGTVSPVAGTGALGERDGPGDSASFSWPNGIATGPAGDRLFVNDFLNRFPPNIETPPVPLSSVRQILLPSLSRVLTAALRSAGLDSLRTAYRAWKLDPSTAGVYTEREINALGYGLMNAGQLPAALAVFELNVESYPNAFNTYDSLAEAYMTAGRRGDAIRNYRKSLELNPANTNATAKLKELEASP